MTDDQIREFIRTQRPDYKDYYEGTLVPKMGYPPGEENMLKWAYNQFDASPEDTQQFNNWVSAGMPTTPPGQTQTQTQGGTSQTNDSPQVLTPPSIPTAGNAVGSDAQYMQYFNSDPAFAQEYNRIQSSGDKRSQLQWMKDYIQASPGDAQKFSTMLGGSTGGGLTVPNDTSGTSGTPQVGTGGTGTTGTGFTSLFNQAPNPNGGGNYNQVQNAVQSGQFGTVGATTGEQKQTSGETQNQTTSGQTKQTGTQDTTQNVTTGQTTGQTSTTQGTTTTGTQGTSTEQALDTLGFGKLLQGQAGTVGASDATRNAWLTDVMQNGGSGFNSQVDQAVRNSLTGPQVTGAGDSARARMSGYAAADVARNNLNQRLAASEQLAGPTGLATLSTAANPYIGKATSTAGTSTAKQDSTTSGTSNTTGFQNLLGSTNTSSLTDQLQNMTGNTSGFQNLVSKGTESQAGTTVGQSSQAGSGQIPEGQPVKTGGCVLCTAGIELGLGKHHRILRRVIAHKLQVDWKNFRNAARGYFAIFTPIARALLSHPRLAKSLWPLAKAVVYEELRVSGRRLPLKLWPWTVHWTGHTLCAVVGKTLPVRGYVTDPVITEIARKNNILFEVKS